MTSGPNSARRSSPSGAASGQRVVGCAVEGEEHLAHGRAHAAVDEPRRDVELEPVHVPAPRRAGPDHLEAREPGAPVDVLPGELGFRRPDPGLEPLHQREVVAVPAQQRHRRVAVPVHESGDQRVSVAGDLGVAGPGCHAGAQPDDDAVDGPQCHPDTVEHDVGDAQRVAHDRSSEGGEERVEVGHESVAVGRDAGPELVERERCVAEPVGQVVHHTDRGVGQPDFARQDALGRDGHPHEVRHAAERAHLGPGLEPRAARLRVDPTVDEWGPGGGRPRVTHRRPPRRVEAGHRVAAGIVVVARGLVRCVAVVGQRAGAHGPVGPQAADRREREHAVDAGTEQRGDVRTVVDPVRRGPRVQAVALEDERAADVEHRDPAVLHAPAGARKGAVAQCGSGDHTEGHARTVRTSARVRLVFWSKSGVMALEIGDKTRGRTGRRVSPRRARARARGSCGTRVRAARTRTARARCAVAAGCA